MKQKISVAITTYQRIEFVREAIYSCVKQNMVDEVIIVDDASTNGLIEKIKPDIEALPHNEKAKIKTYQNDKNIGMLRNKERSVRLAKNNWVIMLDSDNELSQDYFEAIEKEVMPKIESSENDVSNIIFCPEKALPNFDFNVFSNSYITPKSISEWENTNHFGSLQVLLNTCNYLVNRRFYLESFIDNDNIKGSDTIYHAYNHFKNGGKLFVVKDMIYTHRVHPNSTWMQHADKNMADAKAILNQIISLGKTS